MTTILYKKGIVLTIICLFIGASIVPSISGDIDQRNRDEDILGIGTLGETADVGLGKIRIDTRGSISILDDELHDASAKWIKDDRGRISGGIKYDLTYYKQPSTRLFILRSAIVKVRPYAFKGSLFEYDLCSTRHLEFVPDDNLMSQSHSFEVKLLYDDLTSKEKQDKEFMLTFVLTAKAWVKMGQIFPSRARQSKDINIYITFE